MLVLATLEIISSILYIIAGIISTTKWSIKLKVKVGLEAIALVANLIWMLWCIGNGAFGYIWVGLLYVILGVAGIINFTRIYRKAKNGKEYNII